MKNLSSSLVAAGLMSALNLSASAPKIKPAKIRRTSLSPAQQREVWNAAIAKRERRQARNLANAKLPQEHLL